MMVLELESHVHSQSRWQVPLSHPFEAFRPDSGSTNSLATDQVILDAVSRLPYQSASPTAAGYEAMLATLVSELSN